MFHTVSKILRSFIIKKSKNQLLLGRWKLKHNIKECEIYLDNYYGEPGYPNKYKKKWLNNHKLK